jgi:hypothetical protein
MFRNIAAAAIVAGYVGTSVAHHGSSSQFDQSKTVEVEGIVTKIAFVNPHAYVYFDVTDESGETRNWHCEMRAATMLRRSGWTEEMFSPGTHISIQGSPSRKEENGCYAASMTLDEGEEIQRYAQIEENMGLAGTARPARLANGQPNISGDWAAPQRPPPGAPMGEGSGMSPPGWGGGQALTAAGEEALAILDNPEEDRRLTCRPRDFFQDWTFDQHPNRIIQEDDKITLRYGFMDTIRTIHLNMDTHPDGLEPGFTGHSIGKWEGDELVVDTIGFTMSGYRGAIHSEEFHTVERFALEEGGQALKRSYVAEDPLFYAEPRTGEDIVYPSDYPWELYACDDRTVE